MQDIKNNKEKKRDLATQYNVQANFFMQDSLDVISKLPNEEMQSTVIDILQKRTEHQMDIENRTMKIHEEKHAESVKDAKQARLSKGIGIALATIFAIFFMVLIFYLFIIGKDEAAMIVFSIPTTLIFLLNFFKRP